MKKVCVNRLKTEVDKLQYFVNSLEHQEETLETLFQCIMRLFENEIASGNPCSDMGHMNATATNGLLASQFSIFNSKDNISGLNLDSVGMSFGKATDDGHIKGQKQALGQSNGGAALIKNMNRKHNSDRNIFSQANGKKRDDQKSNRLTNKDSHAQEEIESEVVQMGELLRNSFERKELQKRMTDLQQLQASPRFNDQAPKVAGGPPMMYKAKGTKDKQRQSHEVDQAKFNQSNRNRAGSNTVYLSQNAAAENRDGEGEQSQQETPRMKNEEDLPYRQLESRASHQSPLQPAAMTAYGIPTSVKALPPYDCIQSPLQQQMMLKESHDTISTSKLLGGGISRLSNQVQQSSWQHMPPELASHNQIQRGGLNAYNNSMGHMNQRENANGRSFKEVVKVFVSMMVEDIWAYFEGFQWQKKLLLQSEEKKRKKKRQAQTGAFYSAQRATTKLQPKRQMTRNMSKDFDNKLANSASRDDRGKKTAGNTKLRGQTSATSQQSQHERSQAAHGGCAVDQTDKARKITVNPLDEGTASSASSDFNSSEQREGEEKYEEKYEVTQIQNLQQSCHEEVVSGDSIVESGRGEQNLLQTANDLYLHKKRTSPRNQTANRISFCKANQKGQTSQNQLPPVHSLPNSQERHRKYRVANSYRQLEGPTSSLNLSKKSSSVSNYKMDFIDPCKKQNIGAKIHSSRNKAGGRVMGEFNSYNQQQQFQTSSQPSLPDYSSSQRFIDLTPSISSKTFQICESQQNQRVIHQNSSSGNFPKMTIDQLQARERSQAFLNAQSSNGPAQQADCDVYEFEQRSKVQNMQQQRQPGKVFAEPLPTGFESSKSEINLIRYEQKRQLFSGTSSPKGVGCTKNKHVIPSQKQVRGSKNSNQYRMQPSPSASQQQTSDQLYGAFKQQIANNTTTSEDERNSFINLTVKSHNSRQEDSCMMVRGGSGGGATNPTATSGNAPTSLHPNHLFKQRSSNDAVKMRYIGSRNQDLQPLTLTTNSLVSPADLEAASDYEFDQHYKTISSQPGSVTKPAFLPQPQILSSRNSSSGQQQQLPRHSTPTRQQQQQQLQNNCNNEGLSPTKGTVKKRASQDSWPVSNGGNQIYQMTMDQEGGVSSPKENMSPEISRRMLENVAAIEQSLDLAPVVSIQIGTIHEQKEESELSDTQKTLKEKNLNRMFCADAESPDFPKRESNDEVHKAQVSLYKEEQGGVTVGSDQLFENHIIDYEVNPFSARNESRQYIDDMSSSSGNPSGYSENADCLPIVEHMQENKTQQYPLAQSQNAGLRGGGPGPLPLDAKINDFDVAANDSFAGICGDKNQEFLTHQQKQNQKEIQMMYTDDQQMLPRPNRSSTSYASHEFHSAVKEMGEKEYEQMIKTDKTLKQYNLEDQHSQQEVLTPKQEAEYASASIVARQEERTTERKKKSGKRTREKTNQVQLVQAPLVERSGSHRQMQLTKPIQPAPIDLVERREQPMSLLLQDHRNPGSTIVDQAQSLVTAGGKTQQYETADQVVSQYQNLNFMPQKNEGRDRLEILQKSREFNPVIEFDLNSPFSSHQLNSSRSNSDLPLQTANSLNLTMSQNFSNLAAGGKVMPFCQKASDYQNDYPNGSQTQQHPGNMQNVNLMVQKSLESAATQLHYQPPESMELQPASSSGGKQSSKQMNVAAPSMATKKQGNSHTPRQQILAQSSQLSGASPGGGGCANAIHLVKTQTNTTAATTNNNVAQAAINGQKNNSTISSNQVESPALNPLTSPVIKKAKSAAKPAQTQRSIGKNQLQNQAASASITTKHQQYQSNVLHKKMMQTDQQIAFAKQQKKLQYQSASATSDKLQNSLATNQSAINISTSEKPQQQMGAACSNGGVAVSAGGGGPCQVASPPIAKTQTPKAIKGKSFSKHQMTLSNTISKGIQNKNTVSQKKFK